MRKVCPVNVCPSDERASLAPWLSLAFPPDCTITLRTKSGGEHECYTEWSQIFNSSVFTSVMTLFRCLTSLLNVIMMSRIHNGEFHHFSYYFSVEMFISSLPALLLGSSLLHIKQHRADCGSPVRSCTNSSQERKQREKKGLFGSETI